MFSKLFSILLVTVNLFALAKTQNCSPPQYYDINSNQCQNCLDNCNMCNTNSSCDSCKPGFYLFNKNKYC